MTSTDTAVEQQAPTTRARSRLYSVLIGLSALAVLLQGLWAGLFLSGQQGHWVWVHARGGEVALGFALVATIVALVKLRQRRELVIGSIALTVLLVLEAFVGGEIEDTHTLTAVHIPLALALMALATWLPLRSAQR